MTADRFKAEQDAARKVFEAERALKEQQGFHVADAKRRRHVWAVALERALLDIEELNDDARDMRGDLFRAQEEQVKTRADATFRLGTMAMDLEAARAALEEAEDKAKAERSYAEELEATLERVRAELEAARAEAGERTEVRKLKAANFALASELAELRAATAGA